MYKIEKATQEHFSYLLEMSEHFYNSTPYAKFKPFDSDAVGKLLEDLIQFHVVLVALKNNIPIGMVAAEITNLPINPDILVCAEQAWWVNPEHRGTTVAVRLIRALEEAAEEEAVDAIIMSKLADSPASVDKIYAKAGYLPAESVFVKDITWQH